MASRTESRRPPAFVAHMSGIDAAARAELTGQRDDLFGPCVASRLVDETGGEADRARLHAFAHPGAHPIHLLGGGRALLEAHGSRPQRAVAHEHGAVQARTSLLHASEILLEAGPRGRRRPRMD